MNLKEYSGVSYKGNKPLRTRSVLYVPDDMMEVTENNIYDMTLDYKMFNSSTQLQFRYDSFYAQRNRYTNGSKMYISSRLPQRISLLSKSKKEVYI